MDAGYRGEDKGAEWVKKTLGWSVDVVERPRKPAPEEVLMAWAREWAREGVKADWQKLMPSHALLGVVWLNATLGASPTWPFLLAFLS